MTRKLRWVASSHRDLQEFPDEARREALFALDDALNGDRHPSAKPLKGFGGASVMEVVCDDLDGTFRVVFLTKFDDAIYVLHAFQKKSTKGRETPQRHIEKIQSRLKLAIEDHKSRS